MSGYTGGRIQKIKLKNFMTYDVLTLYPKHGLNLIVGLNGSGKSSIMCAICLGLAGKPQHTGKGTQLSDYIKLGQDEAVIELELERPSRRNLVICRKIKGNKSEWLLNNKPAKPNEVEEVVKSFNINTSNLCQFLPQEKVIEFSKMNKKQRLENLLQSIGEPHLYELYNELKELRLEYCKIEDAVNKMEQNKTDCEQESGRLLPEVEKQEERERVKNNLKLFERRKLMLIYDQLKMRVTELSEQKKLISAQIKELERKLMNVDMNKNSILAVSKTHLTKISELKVKIAALQERVSRNITKLSELGSHVYQANVKYENTMKEKEDLKQKLEGMKLQILGLEETLRSKKEENKDIEEHKYNKSKEHKRLTHEIATHSAEIEQNLNLENVKLQTEVQSVNGHLIDMDNDEKRKLLCLKKMDYITYQAYLWLQQNRSQFRQNIYNPIIMEIKVSDKSNCKYIENHISKRNLTAFVCENQDDCLKFGNILLEQNLLSNIVMAPNIPLSNFKSPNIPKEFRNNGLACFLKDLFSAPEPVMKYLCQDSQVHRVPVSKMPLTSDLMEAATEVFTQFYANNKTITSRKSRYGNKNKTVVQNVIVDKHILTVQDDNRREQLMKKLEELVKEKEAILAQIKSQSDSQKTKEELLEKNKQELNKLIRISRNLEDMEAYLKQKKATYLQYSTEVIDEKAEKEKASEKIRNANCQRHNLLSEQSAIFKEIFVLMKKMVGCILRSHLSLKKLNSIETERKELTEEIDASKNQYLVIKEKKSCLYSEGMAIKKKIHEFYNFATNLTHLPDDLEEIERRIIHFRTQLNMNSEADETQLKEYKRLTSQIKEIEKKIDHRKNDRSSLIKKIAAIKREWLPQLDCHIENINKNFSQYFKFLHCAGEISLDTCDDSDDFLNYGLQIRLKYREDEPFTELSQTHHSGGECSVAAIIFILSLQELTEVPFRCIDEINQGMDSTNERKIYQLIADNSSDGTNSQYFLLTPKLLMNLPYHQNIGVHILHNSCYMDTKIDIKSILKMTFHD